MPAYIRTLSQLPEISAAQLANNAYFQVSNPVSAEPVILENNQISINFVYASKKIKKEEVSKDILNDVRRDFAEKEHIDGQDFGWLYNDHLSLINENYELYGQKTFDRNPKHANEISDFYEADKDDYSVNFDALKKYSNLNSAPTVGPTFGFVTHLSGTNNKDAYYNLFRIDKDGNNVTVENTTSFVFSPYSAKVLAQNEFVFRIEPGERESKAWEAPASGIFTCYGWLDEIHNEKVSNENRWVALMGYQAQLGVWTTLQLQPFIKNNYLSYIGFTFPVHKGMQLKVVTGFPVGSNSDKYFKNGSAVANNVANAFLGGIYTGLSVDNGGDYNLSFENVDPDTPITPYDPFDPTDLCNMICAQISHEMSCDEIVDAQISALSTEITVLSTEVEKRVKYIDAANYQPAMYSDSSQVRFTTIQFGNARLSASRPGVFNVKQTGWYGRHDPNGKSEFKALSINWSDSPTGQIRMVLPRHTTIEESTGREITHGYDYYLSAIPPGAVFSDGMYIYYCVSQDSTVQITLDEDPDGCGGSWMCCRMLFGNDRVNSYRDIRTILLATQWETYSGNGPSKRTTLPLKKGTILMFEYFMAETLKPFTDNPHNIPSVQENNTVANLGDLINNANYRTYSRDVTNDGKNVKWYTHLVYADGSNIYEICNKNATESNPNKKDWRTSFGRLARIVEMP